MRTRKCLEMELKCFEDRLVGNQIFLLRNPLLMHQFLNVIFSYHLFRIFTESVVRVQFLLLFLTRGVDVEMNLRKYVNVTNKYLKVGLA